MSKSHTLAVALLLSLSAATAAADCLSFRIFQIPQSGEAGWESNEPQLIKALKISRNDIIKVQAVTEVGSPDPQNMGELFEYLEGNLEPESNAEQHFVVFYLSPRASAQIVEASEEYIRPLLRISREDTIINEAVLMGGGRGDWPAMQFGVEDYAQALAFAKLLGESCD